MTYWFAKLATLVLLAGGMLLAPVAPRWLRAIIVVPAATWFAIAARRELRASGTVRASAGDGAPCPENSLEGIGRTR